jgi:hypothetical protein
MNVIEQNLFVTMFDVALYHIQLYYCLTHLSPSTSGLGFRLLLDLRRPIGPTYSSTGAHMIKFNGYFIRQVQLISSNSGLFLYRYIDDMYYSMLI